MTQSNSRVKSMQEEKKGLYTELQEMQRVLTGAYFINTGIIPRCSALKTCSKLELLNLKAVKLNVVKFPRFEQHMSVVAIVVRCPIMSYSDLYGQLCEARAASEALRAAM